MTFFSAFSPSEKQEKQFMGELYQKYFSLIKKRISDAIPSSDIEDCIQDCFLRLIHNIKQLMKLDSSQITLYILRTIHSVIADYKKKKKLLVFELDEEMMDPLFVEASPVEEMAENHDAFKKFIDGFHTLSETDQIILRYLYYENCTQEEIAKQLGIKPDSVRTYVSRAKKHAIALMRGDSHEK